MTPDAISVSSALNYLLGLKFVVVKFVLVHQQLHQIQSNFVSSGFLDPGQSLACMPFPRFDDVLLDFVPPFLHFQQPMTSLSSDLASLSSQMFHSVGL